MTSAVEQRRAGRHRGRPPMTNVVGAPQVVGDEAEHLGERDTGEEVDRQVVEGQDPDVPESALGQQQEDHREDPGGQGERHPEAGPAGSRR